jgi:hypothetical protein
MTVSLTWTVSRPKGCVSAQTPIGVRMLALALLMASSPLPGCRSDGSPGEPVVADTPTVTPEVGPDPSSTSTVTPPATPTPPATSPPPITPTPPSTPTRATTSSPTATPTPLTPPLAVCGNGLIERGETCDDGGFCVGDSVNISCEDNKQNCPDGRMCMNRFCVCENNSQCEAGQECSEGFCLLRCTRSEDCPSGRCKPAGGDGCAANCTDEDVRVANLDPDRSPSRAETTFGPIDLNLIGVQRFRTGQIRGDQVIDPQGDVVTEPGEMPVVIKADVENGPLFAPVPVAGLVCACVRQVPVPDLFGPNNSGVGKIGCGEQGLTDVDYRIFQDHNTNPSDPRNGTTIGMGLPQLEDDPECDDEFVFPSGVVSKACRENRDPLCTDASATFHTDICNSPRRIEFSGGQAPRGSALIDNSTAIGLLNDNGKCKPGRIENGKCIDADDPRIELKDYGPDCLPCTQDDRDMGTQENLPTTTGRATGTVYDAGFVINAEYGFPVPITDGAGNACNSDDECAAFERCRRTCDLSGFSCSSDADCPGDTCRPRQCEVFGCGGARCLIAEEGTEFSCELLQSNPTGGLSGGALAVTFPDIDARQIGDNVTASVLGLE